MLMGNSKTMLVLSPLLIGRLACGAMKEAGVEGKVDSADLCRSDRSCKAQLGFIRDF